VVEQDPAISGRVLQLANSAFYQTRWRTDSLKMAILRLGTAMVGHVALGYSLIKHHRKGPCPEFDYDRFWSECVGRSVAARHLAAHSTSTERVDKDVAFTGGLLCQIGRLALATVYPQEYGVVLSHARGKKPLWLLECEREAFGLDHNILAALMMADWRMSEGFCGAVHIQDDPIKENFLLNKTDLQLSHILRWSGHLAHVFLRAGRIPGKNLCHALMMATDHMGISTDKFGTFFDETKTEWSDIGAIFEVPVEEVAEWGTIYQMAG
jgi:HD-like signal output (HDOD) protein